MNAHQRRQHRRIDARKPGQVGRLHFYGEGSWRLGGARAGLYLGLPAAAFVPDRRTVTGQHPPYNSNAQHGGRPQWGIHTAIPIAGGFLTRAR